MITVDTIGKVRRAFYNNDKAIKEIARDFRLSRNTVRGIVRSDDTERRYERTRQPRPMLDGFTDELDRLLARNERVARRERLSFQQMFEELRLCGYQGGYDAVRRYGRRWQREHAGDEAEAYVPLTFDPGEAYQFDWSHEVVVMAGVTTTVKVAHVRLCHSRMPFLRAYPREAQEMVFDAHEKAFCFFKGAARRGIYDNMKTAVDAVFVGKERKFNRRFEQLMSHHLVEPAACTPAAGWEKGQVENQVGVMRRHIFTPRLRFKSYEELNAYLLDRCIAYAKAHAHPQNKERTIFEMFEAERSVLMPYKGPFDGFRAVTASVSKTCLVSFDKNKYSVLATAVGRPVDIYVYATRLVIKQDGEIVGEHERSFATAQTVYNPWHYVPVLARKPGALRNGAPFKGWVLPKALARVRRRLNSNDDGDRQMVKILTAVLTDGLAAVEAACLEALDAGLANADVVLNVLARQQERDAPPPIQTPTHLVLRCTPLADCARYDRLLSTISTTAEAA